MVAMVLLRCYQYHRHYDHIWAANCKVFQGYLCLEGDPYYIFYNLCRCILVLFYLCRFLIIILVLSYPRYKYINNDPSFYPSRWPLLYIYFTISVDFFLLYWLVLSTGILIMIHLPPRWSLLYIYFIFCVGFPLLYCLALSTSILIMIHLPSRWSLPYNYFTFFTLLYWVNWVQRYLQ